MHPWVRHAKPRAVDALSIVEQQIEIERSRRMVKLATTAELALDGEQRFKQGLRRQTAMQGSDGVDEVGLSADADRRSAVQRGQSLQPAVAQFTKCIARGAHLLLRIVEIGA